MYYMLDNRLQDGQSDVQFVAFEFEVGAQSEDRSVSNVHPV
jgi:hypothetical protein